MVPILIWCLVSYVPWIWHPQIFITNPGSVDYLQAGMRMDKEAFADEVVQASGREARPASRRAGQSDLSARAA